MSLNTNINVKINNHLIKPNTESKFSIFYIWRFTSLDVITSKAVLQPQAVPATADGITKIVSILVLFI